ncbi:MAG: hypothetical protein H0W61_06060 [Bacteroidetes bacterium]|nr:hypothetical protein [Bacteroidota bacterium]
MITQNIFITIETKEFQQDLLSKGSWLVILHAERFPPHAGLLFNGSYNSLTIKEAELDINKEVLFKTISQKKIKSFLLKLLPHPVFSLDHQKEMFQEELKKAGSVKHNQATCLSPIKLFFKDFYGIQSAPEELLFDFIRQLVGNSYVEYALSLHIQAVNGIDLPFYTHEELNEKIKTERQTYYSN